MALESALYISDLNVSNPLSTDAVSQADDHLRLIKQVLKNTFPNLTGPVTSTQATLNAPVPSGFIGMWSGAINAVPSGWFLCNGLNGTPDLRDRFIVGAGSTYAVGDTGGAAQVTLNESQIPAHTHSITATTAAAGDHSHTINDPGHAHSFNGGGVVNNGYYPGGNIYAGGGGTTSGSGTGISINNAGSHTHTITATAATTGGGLAHENRPPYYALAYIMKS